MSKTVLFDSVYIAGSMLDTLSTMMHAMDPDVAELDQNDVQNIAALLRYFGKRMKEISGELDEETKTMQKKYFFMKDQLKGIANASNEIVTHAETL